MRSSFIALLLLISLASADVYLHSPRGSNNRLNERSANRANGDRVFDSQNNNRGGYNTGDRASTEFADTAQTLTEADNPDSVYATTTPTPGIYSMLHYESSIIPVEFTAQHGCGGHEGTDPQKLNCNVVIQYMCEADLSSTFNTGVRDIMSDEMRDGTNTNTPDAETNTASNVNNVATNNKNNRRVRHESESWYYNCVRRNRNKGLFLADQIVNRADATGTRQNPNGNRRGLECPEERDYYPYWVPSPWRDVAYITDQPEMFCDANGNFKGASQNNNVVYKCIDTSTGSTSNNDIPTTDAILDAVTQSACTAAGGTWKGFKWNIPAPKCIKGDDYWSRVNHLGNGRSPTPLVYNWTLPTITELTNTGARVRTTTSGVYVKCAMRLRYNISTDDYDPWRTNSSFNENPNAGIFSPVQDNPDVDVGSETLTSMRLAINTNQFGRTFQDRSHVFYIKQRPASLNNKKILNLNVRGKRGNIVQTFPAVEYDFVPGRLHVDVSNQELVHWQWTGSNTHNNGHPGGDGQTGDAGEGRGGTDRSNVALIGISPCPANIQSKFCGDISQNFPLPLDEYTDNMFSRSSCYDPRTTSASLLGTTWIDCALTLSSSGYFHSVAEYQSNLNDNTNLNPLLNNAPASLIGGVIMDFSKNYAGTTTTWSSPTTYNYMCTRNNNFSNRSQKGTLIIQA